MYQLRSLAERNVWLSVGFMQVEVSAGAPLVEQDSAMTCGVEVAPGSDGATGPRPTMEINDWETVGLADLFEIEDVALPDVELTDVERLPSVVVHTFRVPSRSLCCQQHVRHQV